MTDARASGKQALAVLLVCAAAVAVSLAGTATGRYSLYAVLMLAAIYAPLVVGHWPLAARISIAAFAATPLMAAVPAFGAPFAAAAAVVLLAVGFAGATVQRTLRALPILVLVAWELACALHTFLPSSGTSGAWSVLVMPLGAIGMYLTVQSSPRRMSRVLMYALVVVGVIESLIAISQSMTGQPVFALAGAPDYQMPRSYLSVLFSSVSPWVRLSTGTFEHFNGLGALLSMVVPLCLWWWLRNRDWYWLAVLLITSVALVLTFSRGGLIGALIGCMFVFVMTSPPHTRVAKVLVVAAVVFLAGFALRDGLIAYSSSTNSLAPRVSVWRVAMAHYGENPETIVVGSGLGSVQRVLESQGASALRVHSGPIQMLLETGIVGCALFVYALVYAFRRGRPYGRGASTACGGAVIAFWVTTIADNSMAGILGVVWLGLVTTIAVLSDRSRAPVWRMNRLVEPEIPGPAHGTARTARPEVRCR